MRKLCVIALIALSSRAYAACPTAPPQLVAPANSASNIASPVHFDWNDVPGARAYNLWAAFNGGTANIIGRTTDSQYTTDLPSGTIDWWVDALGDTSACAAQTSTHFRFTAIGGTASCPQNPSSPTLLQPAPGATNLTSPVTLTWTAVPMANSYRVFASVNGTPSVVLGTTATTQLSVAIAQGNVSWFVEAQFPGGCPSTFSRFGTFAVTAGATCPTTAATLVSPANGATVATSPVNFQWTSVPGAVGYKLFIGSDLVATTVDTSAGRLVGTGTMAWHVDTMFAACPDVSSQQFTFTVPAPACGGSVSLTSPADNASVSSPVALSWTTVANATAYRVWVSVDGGPPVVVARVSNNAQTLPLPSGAIEWYVEALFASCPSVLSPHSHFTVSRGSCNGNQAPVLTSPISGTQNDSNVTFNWNSVPGAILYRLWILSDGDAFEDVAVTKATSVQAGVGTGTIEWYVEALFAGCPAVASNKASFTIPETACSSEKTLLISPANAATGVTSPVPLVWSAVDGADEYRVWTKDASGKNIVIARTSGDVTSITKNLPPGSIEWWVEADFDSCPGTKSAHSTFTIPHGTNCPTDGPELVSPVDGASSAASPVRLDWDPVSGAVGYSVLLRHDGGAPTLLGQTTNTELTRRLPEGNFEWWVIAFFANCPSAESQHHTFTIPPTTCSNRQPLLMTPADGSTGLGSSVRFSWTPVPKATSYKIWAAAGDDNDASVLTTTTSNRVTMQMPTGDVDWYVEALFAGCPSVTSATSGFSVRKNAPACATPARPVAQAPGQVQAGSPFTIVWNAVANATNYELQEATSASFAGATTQTVADTSITLTRSNPGINPGTAFRYFYRVRAVSNCNDERGPFSKVVSVVLVPQQSRSTSVDVSVQNGITQLIALPPQNPPAAFTAHGDKPWITVTPANGTVGPQGAILNVTFDASALKLGTNSGAVIVSYAAAKIKADGVAPVIPVSVSLVTPVAPGGKNTPPPDSLIIPAVGHAPGANNSMFESDVRVVNTSARIQKYQLNFTLTGTNGTQAGQSTTIQINPGDTMALNDILANFFGIGSDGTAATGVLEVRPLSSSGTPSVQTVASSRTFNTTPTGTFGQFVPAIAFSQFVGQGSRLSLQQISQSSAFRTNLGLVEAEGEPADVVLHVFDDGGHEVATIPQHLLASEHLQLNAILPAITDGRVEVEVTSATGKVTAYASVVDNVTNDPLLVSPVTKGTVSAQRYTLPGVGDFDIGIAHWKSDVRIFNSGASPAQVTLTYLSQTATMTIAANSVLALDNIIATMWPSQTQTASSLLVTTPSSSGLVVSAKTYTQTSSGTYGQFIPGVTPSQAIGAGDPVLQVLQLESSDSFRTNIGLAETSGNAAVAHVSLILPDSKFAISTDIPLAANQFVQFPLSSFGAGTVYNGRVTVSVTGGSGRVTAYGSVIDQLTQDPTFVPAQ